MMKVMKIVHKGALESLVLVAGDGDFKDLVEYLTEDLLKNVYIVAFRESLSPSLQEKTDPDHIFYLDSEELWPLITKEIPKEWLEKNKQGDSGKKVK